METFSELLESDHRRLDAIAGDLYAMIEDGELERAEGAFADLDEGLRRHIRVEEEVLFPLFDQRTLMIGPSRVMRHEHRAIERMLSDLGRALGKCNQPDAAAALNELLHTLEQHNLKEERVLYPHTDRALPDDERRVQVARAAALLTPSRSTSPTASPDPPPAPRRGAAA